LWQKEKARYKRERNLSISKIRIIGRTDKFYKVSLEEDKIIRELDDKRIIG
jgi:hypothetical protein